MFIGVQLTLVVICTLVLWLHDVYSSALTTLNQAFFQVVSMATTGVGFTTWTVSRAGRYSCRCCYCARHLLAVVPGRRRRRAEGYPYTAVVQTGEPGTQASMHPNAVYSTLLGEPRCRNVFWRRCGDSSPMRWCSLLAWAARSSRPEMTFLLSGPVVATLKQPRARTWRSGDNFATMNPVAQMDLIANMLFGRLEVFTLLVPLPHFLARITGVPETLILFSTRDGQTREIGFPAWS